MKQEDLAVEWIKASRKEMEGDIFESAKSIKNILVLIPQKTSVTDQIHRDLPWEAGVLIP